MGKGSCFSPFFFYSRHPSWTEPGLRFNRAGVSCRKSLRSDPKTVDPAVGDGWSLYPSDCIRAYTTGQDSKSI